MRRPMPIRCPVCLKLRMMNQRLPPKRVIPSPLRKKEEFDRLREQNAADKEEDRRNSVWRKGNIRLEYIANEKLKSPASEIESDWGFALRLNEPIICIVVLSLA